MTWKCRQKGDSPLTFLILFLIHEKRADTLNTDVVNKVNLHTGIVYNNFFYALLAI